MRLTQLVPLSNRTSFNQMTDTSVETNWPQALWYQQHKISIYCLNPVLLFSLLTHDSPENRSQSSPLMFSGMPCSTSSLVLSVRYMHTPWPYSVKWFLQACSFRNSLAWNMSIKRATHLLPWLQLHKCWCRRLTLKISAGKEAKPVNFINFLFSDWKCGAFNEYKSFGLDNLTCKIPPEMTRILLWMQNVHVFARFTCILLWRTDTVWLN